MIRLISAGVLSQIVVALVALFRTPIIINSLGPKEFGSYVALIGSWAVMAAVGEGYRANLRQSRLQEDLNFRSLIQNYAKNSWISVVAVLPAILILYFASMTNSDSVDWFLFLVVAALGFVYPIFAGAVGRVESQGKFTWFHGTTIIGQTISLLTILFLGESGNIYIFAIATLLPAFAPGAFAFWKMRGQPIRAGRVSSSVSFNHFYSLVIVFETVAYSLDSAILLAVIGPSAAAEFAVMQRLMVFFSVIPLVLAPLIAYQSNIARSSKWLKRVQINQTLFAIGISIFLLIFAGYLFDFLTQGLVTFNFWLLVVGCTNGVVGSFASTTIQSVSASTLMRKRFFGSVLLVLVSTIVTISLVQVAGPSAAFFGTIVGTLAYWLVARRLKESS
jgi:hypothetical protein